MRLIAPLLALLSCASPPPADAPHEAAPPDPPAPQTFVGLVEAAAVVSECADSAKMDSKGAQLAIRKLVEPCSKVPGGRAHFAATLLPNGRIELAGPGGDPAEGVVPTCVLQHQLNHKVALRKPCRFDVRLDERPVPVPDGALRDAGTDAASP